MGFSISFKKETKKTSIAHNNRQLTEEQKVNDWHKHIDFSKSRENNYLKQIDIQKKYEELFGQQVREYNEKQKRADRQIENYLAKVRKDGKLEPQREFIMQVGTVDDFQTTRPDGSPTGLTEEQAKENRQVANLILCAYYYSFQIRNPNLVVYNAVIHNDEQSPHLHLNVIPVAEGYKRGVQKQPSFNKALVQQGLSGANGREIWQKFREQETNSLQRIMERQGWEREQVGTNKIKDIHEYKEVMGELAKLRQTVVKARQEVSNELEDLTVQKEEIQRKKALQDAEREEILERQKKIDDAQKLVDTIYEKEPVDLSRCERLPDGSCRLPYEDLYNLQLKAENAINTHRNAKKQMRLAQELVAETAEERKTLKEKNAELQSRTAFLEIHYELAKGENKQKEQKIESLEQENRRLTDRLDNLRAAFRRTVSYVWRRFGFGERETYDLSQEFTILEQEESFEKQRRLQNGWSLSRESDLDL